MLQKFKKGNLLTENLVFILLNLAFFGMLVGFIYLQSSSTHLQEQGTAKQIALILDVAKPNTIIELNLEDFFVKSDKEGISRQNAIMIDNEKNLVIVRGSKNSFYDYSFFNEGILVSYVINGNSIVMTLEENQPNE